MLTGDRRDGARLLRRHPPRLRLGTSSGRQFRQYDVTGPDGVTTSVILQLNNWAHLDGPTSQDDTRAGYRPYDLTIGGRTAREWRNDSGRGDWTYTVVLALPGDHVAQVQVSVPPDIAGCGTSLANTGRRVAGSLQLDRAKPIDTAFRPTSVPSGLAVQAVAAGPDATTWVLSAPRDPAA